VNFSDEYILQHKDKFEVEIPEVHELANILVALSNVGKTDSNMVDMTTPHYLSVMHHFLPFDQHPVLDTINHVFNRSTDQEKYWYYYALKMNACGYAFTEDNQIVNKGIIKQMGFRFPPDPIVELRPLMEDFAEKSNFRTFYRDNKTYYDSLVVLYRQLIPIDKMQDWLKRKFGVSYGNYTVIFSPLVGGAHATQRYKDNHFEQTVMFVCRATHYDAINNELNEMINSRVVFTELDHNYVNPVSDKNKGKIKRSLRIEIIGWRTWREEEHKPIAIRTRYSMNI
jgi:hypothetical protein